MSKHSVRHHAQQLLRRTSPQQKDAYLYLLRAHIGTDFAERVARYADSHPVLR